MATIVSTIAVQFYWNYKNYQENRQRVINEIQLSFDTAIEEYYASLAKTDFITILKSDSEIPPSSSPSSANHKHRQSISEINITTTSLDELEVLDSMVNKLRLEVADTAFRNAPYSFTQLTSDTLGFNVDTSGTIEQVTVFKGKNSADSIRLIQNLQPIFIALMRDSVNYDKLDSLFLAQLSQKKVALVYQMNHFRDTMALFSTADSQLNDDRLRIQSKSTFIRPNEEFQLEYNRPTRVALQRSSTGILLSLLLALAVISSLFYLLKIINQQKELAEIKNDLISNITHEFKTPIATVSTAVEALLNFDVTGDKEKTLRYLNISSAQLNKLHQMVEKLLETATLDSENLLMNKEPVALTSLIEKLANKYAMIADGKQIEFTSNHKNIEAHVDKFHFENAISNLIDNAVKYGGKTIEISISKVLKNIEISVADNGPGIEKNQLDKIFTKFYRIPTGNRHDVKGFGIGLYYTQKIIEKHQGSISLSANPGNTLFKINLPNE